MTSPAIATELVQGTEAWEDARLDSIGSSDAPVIAGERGSVFELWAVKTRQIDRPPLDSDTAAMFELGHRLEPVIADVYTERVGRPLKRVNRMLRRREDPWAVASLDRVSAVKGERRVVELKTAPWTRWGVGEPVPGDIQAQVQHQLWVTGYDVADVVVLHRGYDLKVHEIARDDAFIDDLVYLEREFRRWVETNTRPPVDGSELTRKALQRMFPDEYGEILPATPEIYKLADELYIAQGLSKAANDQEATLKNAIRALLGDAAGVAGEGFRITWKKNADSKSTDWKAVAQTLERTVESLVRELRPRVPELRLEGVDVTTDEGLQELLDSLRGLFTTTKPGARVLRPWWAHARAADEEEAAA